MGRMERGVQSPIWPQENLTGSVSMAGHRASRTSLDTQLGLDVTYIGSMFQNIIPKRFLSGEMPQRNGLS